MTLPRAYLCYPELLDGNMPTTHAVMLNDLLCIHIHLFCITHVSPTVSVHSLPGGWKEGMARQATVWDGEIMGMQGGMQMAPEDRKILALSDSQAAIAAVRKAGKTGTARTGELKEVVEEVRRRQKNLGPDAVRFAWVKAHLGTQGNERADLMAKSGANLGDEEEGIEKVITEGGLRQEWKRRRAEERKVKGTGMGRVVRWNSRAQVNYVHCRTGKDNLQAWTHFGRGHTRPMPEVRTVCRDRETCRSTLYTWRGYWAAVGDMGTDG